MTDPVLEAPRPTPPIDDRLRARRIEVRRGEGRRRLRRLVAAVVVTVLALIAWGVTRSPLLDVDEIEVAGADRSGVDAVRDAAGIVRGAALVDLDLEGARAGVEGLPWVASADVQRAWGGTVSIQVSERTPVLVVRTGDDSGALVDADGVVLEAASASHLETLPVVEGLSPEAPGERLDPGSPAVLALATELPSSVWSDAEALEVDGSGEVWLRLAPRAGEVDEDGEPRVDGGRVRFGDAREVDDQAVAAATVLARVDLTDVEIIDVRVPSNPTVTRLHGPGADGADGDAVATTADEETEG